MTTLVLLPGMDGTGDLFAPLVAALGPGVRSIVVRYPPDAASGYDALESIARLALPKEEPYVRLDPRPTLGSGGSWPAGSCIVAGLPGKRLHMRIQSVLSLLLCIAAAPVAAQSYRCSSGGQTYLSDRPCTAGTAWPGNTGSAGNSGSARLQAYGPARTTPQYSAPAPGMAKAQDHVKYLGSACASISEAIRTGPARGVRGDVMQGLHEEYRQKCALEDQEARARVQQDMNGQRQVQIAQRESSAADRQQAKALADRCGGMRDVIAMRRKREAELNAKEVEALRGMEKTYNEVCLAR